jgi:hypothetical protein
MRKTIIAGILSAAVATTLSSISFGQPRPIKEDPQNLQAAAKGVSVPVKAVVLFSSGVGYFEHFGTVNGAGSTELRFKTQQINDILKSLVLQDMDGGKVTTISYPSQDPIAKTLRSFQVDITSNPSLGDLLNQLRGAKVKVSLGAEATEGTILGLEKKKTASDKEGTIESWMLNLISGGTIRSVSLDSVTKLELEDPQLQEELGKALLALSQARDQDKKPVTINFTGEGERHIRLGYVVETPIWKTSYRLLLGDKPQLQGWAIVENQTDNDWNDVQLSLVSGRPISFIQDLYQPLYVPRPTVQPELYASLRPQTYEGGMELAKQVERFAAGVPAAPAPVELHHETASADVSSLASRGMNRAALTATRSEAQYRAGVDASSSVASVASAAKIGELFQYTVGSVSLPRQRSAMIPIITDPVEVERVSIYNAQVLARNPLNGAKLKNTTGKHLLAGPITVLDGSSYAGDASIDNVPPGQQRLISFGVDLQVIVDSTKRTSQSVIQTGEIIKGILHLTRKHVMSQEYQAENKGDKDKALIVEHPIRGGWKLLDTDKPIETTPTLYRFQGKVAAGKATQLLVKEEIIEREQYAILSGDMPQLDFYSRQGEIPKDVRDVLIKAMQMKSAMLDTQRQIADLQRLSSQITAEQQRIRENMKTVAANTEYSNRLLKKLNDQESEMEKIQAQSEAARKTLDQQRKELEGFLSVTPQSLQGDPRSMNK